MPRYMVELAFLDDAPIQTTGTETGDDLEVIRVESFLSVDGHREFCLYEAPNPEAVRRTANRSALAISRITQVTPLDSGSFATQLDIPSRDAADIPGETK